MTETLFYATALPVEADGSVKGAFNLSDLTTQFRISANAFDKSGALGFNEKLIQSSKPFSLSF